MLEVKQVSKSYGKQKAVDNISLALNAGSLFGLLGPNGAGKSSLLRMITGITMPDTGEILFNGMPLQLDMHSKHIGYMPEERGLYKKMKIEEQAIYLGQLKGMHKSDAIKQMNYWFDKLEMQGWRGKKVEDLSKGMSQKLQFVSTVMHQPSLLILDEPFSGLDPLNSAIIKEEIYALAKQGTAILFSTHRMEQVEEICEEIVLVNKGNVILNGRVNAIKQQFKKNMVRLHADKDDLVFNEVEVISQKEGEYILKLQQEKDGNQILQSCIQQGGQIKLFQEILPTLNEIFISLVDETPNKKTVASILSA